MIKKRKAFRLCCTLLLALTMAVQSVAAAELPSAARNTEKVTVNFVCGNTVIRSMETEKGTALDQAAVKGIALPGEYHNKQFKFWSATPDGNQFDLSTKIEKDTVLHGVFANSWLLSFDGQGGIAPASRYVEDGKPAGALPAATQKGGYEFRHWSTEADGPAYDPASTPIKKDTTLYAVWAKKADTPYTVVYWLENAEDDGFSVDSVEKKTGTTGATAEYAKKSLPHFSFQKAEDLKIKGDGSTTVNVYYTRDKYTLHLMNGIRPGSSTIQNPQDIIPPVQVKHGASIKKYSDQAFAKIGEGYSWAVPSGMYDLELYVEASLMPKEDLTLYASKGQNEVAYVVLCEVGKDGTPIREIAHHPRKAPYMTQFFGSSLPLKGFTFRYVNKPNKPSDYFKYSDKTNRWEARAYYERNKYDLIFNTNTTETPLIKEQAIPFGSDISTKAQYKVGETKDANGRTFAGWYTNAGLSGASFDFANRTMPDHHVVLYAKWTNATHTVTAHAVTEPTASTEKKAITVSHAESLPAGIQNTLNKTPGEGDDPQKFIGWFVRTADGLRIFNFNTPICEDVELFPMWEKSRFAVEYDLNGGTGTTPVDKLMYLLGTKAFVQAITGVTGSENRPFLGWTTSERAPQSELLAAGSKIAIVTNLRLTAKWGEVPPPVKHSVTFRSNGGSGTMNRVEIEEGSPYTLPENGFTAPEKKKFAGWSVRGKEYKPGDTITVSEPTEVIARWTEQETLKPGTSAAKTKTLVKASKTPVTGESFPYEYVLAGFTAGIALLLIAAKRRSSKA